MSSVEIALSDDPFVGRIVADRFEVLARVGAGGMGTVYRARQMPLERDVALKLLREEVSWDPDTVTRFHREAKAMSLLQHPNTVRVFDFGQTDDDVLFLAMELLEGETITERLSREGALDPRVAVKIAQQVLASLHEAHSKGIVHRDLKPDNIVLADVQGHAQPVVKVLDFGIAKVFEGDNDFDSLETQAGTVFGTPRYMSPEQAQGKSLDARSDLYSVGVLLYQMLTGVPPFQDDDAVVVMAKHIRDEPESIRLVAPTRPITRRLDKVVLRSLEKAREKRYQDATAFASALEKCLPELDNVPAETGVFGRVTTSRKTPWAIAGIVLLLSVVVAGVVVGTSDPVPEPVTQQSVVPVVQAPAAVLSSTLESRPSGALVYDSSGTLLGMTPLRREMTAGDRIEVRLELEGYANTSGVLEAGLTRNVELGELEPVVAEDPEPSAMRVTMRRFAMRAPMTTQPEAEPATMTGYERFD